MLRSNFLNFYNFLTSNYLFNRLRYLRNFWKIICMDIHMWIDEYVCKHSSSILGYVPSTWRVYNIILRRRSGGIYPFTRVNCARLQDGAKPSHKFCSFNLLYFFVMFGRRTFVVLTPNKNLRALHTQIHTHTLEYM